MEDGEVVACMPIREWNELVEIIEKLAEVNGVDS